MTPRRPTFQDAIARLQTYWSDQGCAVWLPHNVEVGAGTMNPATFLHVLGPEPWNVAYVEPGIRPDDARYGENPNRMGRHHQFQVILKPDPGNPQELYLQSLAALGIDLARHDIRFVEDNWESPALGAWGLGWEVWLDGLEITQFTYFQQAGSFNLDPVSVEITYGIDRILMALQDVGHFKDLQWNEHLRFGDVLLSYEIQTSKYYFEEANVARLTEMYDICEAEAELALSHDLTIPAHDYVLRCSHIFNILDARGAVGVTERARFFGRMRRLARAVADAYLREREALGFPLLEREGRYGWVAGRTAEDAPQPTPEAESTTHVSPPSEPETFLLEIGTEELPVEDLDSAMEALEARTRELLDRLRLAHGGVAVFGTPRRLVAIANDLAERQEDVESQVVGPPAKVAFDADGNPTGAGKGFARSAGVEVSDLEIVERGGEERVAALKREEGRPSWEVLSEELPGVIAGLPFARSMRWNASNQTFSRPVRWLVAMHGRFVVPLTFADVESSNITVGLRTAGSPSIALAAAEDYHKVMRTHGIEIDPRRRREEVVEQVDALAADAGGEVPDDPELVREVANLVEQPLAILGSFDEAYLELPAQVLTTVMKKHQRYFPVEQSGELAPHFITVANGAGVDADAVRHGNEAVVRARFADAAYFWKRDTATPLSAFTEALAGLTFQDALGSVLDKVHRLEHLTPQIATKLGFSNDDIEAARRAAALSKSDLATSMVVDFTSLQGVMGREYALRSGESPEVAEAIYEQYLPRGAGDELPQSPAGVALALADRLDSLTGLFAAGLRPTGAQDPFALRRAALGLATILVEREVSLDLRAAVRDAAHELPIECDEAVQQEVLSFVRRRLEGQLREAGHAADAVSAVLAVQGDDPWSAARAVVVLEEHVGRPDWTATLTAYARCARIVRGRDHVQSRVDTALLSEPAELVLYEALEAATQDLSFDNIDSVLRTLAALAPAINAFFDEVLVMTDDERVRENRLALVNTVALLAQYVADLSHMEGF
jgi:glycyl-tRNA synthetase